MYKQAKYHTGKGDQGGKEELSGKLRIQFSSSDSASVWKRYERLYKLQDTIPSHCGESTTSRRFECLLLQVEKTPHTRPEHLSHNHLTPPATPLSPTPALKISEDDVAAGLIKNKRRKAPGPDVCHQPALNLVLTS